MPPRKAKKRGPELEAIVEDEAPSIDQATTSGQDVDAEVAELIARCRAQVNDKASDAVFKIAKTAQHLREKGEAEMLKLMREVMCGL
jgi:hypothetical protein